MLLVCVPVALGVKLTENLEVCPGVNVIGALRPLTPKPEPGPVSCVISSTAVPGLPSVTVCVLVTPNGTLPKLMLLGVIEIDGLTPVPASATETDPCLPESDKLPVMAPGVEGRKDTLKIADCPGSRLTGMAGPVKLKPLPDTAAAEIVVPDPPEFVTVTDWRLLVPTRTLPKSTLLGAASWLCFRAANEEAHEETLKSNATTRATAIPLEIRMRPQRRDPDCLALRLGGTKTAFRSLSVLSTARA